MTQITDIMTRNVSTIEPGATLETAAQRMRDLNVGALPVCEGDALVGIVTDRDIAVRAVAIGKNVRDTRVAEVMSGQVQTCRPTDTVAAVLKQMGDAQLRRLAVVDNGQRIVGIVALGDLATRQTAPTETALREISLQTMR